MSRNNIFSFRVNEEEHRMIAVLAERLQRSQSDSVRWLVRRAVREQGLGNMLAIAFPTEQVPKENDKSNR